MISFTHKIITIEGYHYQQNSNTKNLTPIVFCDTPLVAQQDTGTTKRGRPAKTTPNHLIHVIQAAHWLKISWMDDIVFGAVATVAKTSKGKLNLDPQDIWSILRSTPTLEAEAMPGSSDRTKRLQAQVARFALSGIQHQLDRHTGLQEALENLWLSHSDEFAQTALELGL